MAGEITKVDDANITATAHIVFANVLESLNLLTKNEYADMVTKETVATVE